MPTTDNPRAGTSAEEIELEDKPSSETEGLMNQTERQLQTQSTPPATTTKNKKDSKEKTTGSTKYMKKKTLTILLGILNVFLLAIFIFVLYFYLKDKSQKVTIYPSRTFCLSQEEISIHPDDDPANFAQFAYRKENGKDIYCADDGHNLDKLMQLYVERKHALKAAESNKKELEAACDKTVDDFEPRVMGRVAGIRSAAATDQHFLVKWTPPMSEVPTSFKNNVTFDGSTGEFVINRPGYYYIYSQVTIKVTENDQSSGNSICHYVYKKQTGQTNPEKLLENSRTYCKFQGDQSKSTSYVGAVFNLDKDDRLMVKVSDQNVLEKDPQSNYFGLHMI